MLAVVLFFLPEGFRICLYSYADWALQAGLVQGLTPQASLLLKWVLQIVLSTWVFLTEHSDVRSVATIKRIPKVIGTEIHELETPTVVRTSNTQVPQTRIAHQYVLCVFHI